MLVEGVWEGGWGAGRGWWVRFVSLIGECGGMVILRSDFLACGIGSGCGGLMGPAATEGSTVGEGKAGNSETSRERAEPVPAVVNGGEDRGKTHLEIEKNNKLSLLFLHYFLFVDSMKSLYNVQHQTSIHFPREIKFTGILVFQKIFQTSLCSEFSHQ